MKIKKPYSYSSINRLYYPNTNMPIYEFYNLEFNNKNSQTIVFDKEYFLISTGTNYSHALLDGIGAYYQLKKIYPNLIPIFIEEEFHITKNINNVLKQFAIKNNYEIINLDQNNYIFNKVILHVYYFAPVNFNEIENDNIFNENNFDIFSQFYKNSIQEILKNTTIINNYKNKKIYVSQRISNKYRKECDNVYIAKNLTYPEDYDDEIENLFIKNGFEIVELNGLDLESQIDLFSQCSIVAAIEGTALINLIWATDNCKILSLKMYEMPFIWYELLKSCNKTQILLCDTVGLDIKDKLKLISNYIKML